MKIIKVGRRDYGYCNFGPKKMLGRALLFSHTRGLAPGMAVSVSESITLVQTVISQQLLMNCNEILLRYPWCPQSES